MSVTLRNCDGKDNVWEVDIRILLPNGSRLRERRAAPVAGKTAALRWAQERERVLLKEGKPKRQSLAIKEAPTLKEFAPRFLEGYVRANQHKPSGIAAKEAIMRLHLIPRFGAKRLDEITTEDVQRLKAELVKKSGKTVNNILSVLNVLLRTAQEWNVIGSRKCAIKVVRTMMAEAAFHGFEAFDRLVQAARETDDVTHLVVLLGGEAGLRCGEMMALEWRDIDFTKGQLCVARSEWKGHVTDPKGGRLRYVPLTSRLAEALRHARHSRHARVLCDQHGQSLTQKVVQGIMRRVARRAGVKKGVHILRHTFCSLLATQGAPPRAIQELAGHRDLATTQRYMHLSPATLGAAIRLLERGARPIGGADGEAAGTAG
jgi:integrase